MICCDVNEVTRDKYPKEGGQKKEKKFDVARFSALFLFLLVSHSGLIGS